MQNNRILSYIINLLFYVAGGALVAVSVSCFLAPNNIAAGGLTGIATILLYLFKIPIGITVMVLNIPIFLLGARKLGMRFLCNSLIATAAMSVLIDVAAAVLPTYTGDRLLACIYGGVLGGLGLGLVFMRGATTGGIDILAKLVNIKYPHLSMGKLIMALDALVIIAAAIVYWNIENALYAVITIFTQSRVIDSLIYGADKGKVLLITSKKYREIADNIMTKLHRGVTILEGTGAYTGHESRVIFCAVRRPETAAVEKIIKSTDDHAFIVTFEAGEILGEGFRRI